MAITKLIDLVNPQVMGDMLEAKIPAMLKFTPFAKVDTTLQGSAGDTKTVPCWDFIGAAEDIAEGESIGTKKLTASATRQFTIKKVMQSVSLTQESINSGLGDPVGQAELQLAKSIAVKLDQDVLDAALTSSNTFNGASKVISYVQVVDIVGVFDEEEITDKVMFIAPAQVTTLRKDSDFISADKYDNKVMMTGEIGMIAGVRIVPSKKVPLVKATLNQASGGTTISSSNIDTYQGHVWDATNKQMVTIKAGDKIDTVTANYYLNPTIKLEPASDDTEFTEQELPAITLFLKKETQVDREWFPKSQTMDITAAKYYGVSLTNATKVVMASIKA